MAVGVNRIMRHEIWGVSDGLRSIYALVSLEAVKGLVAEGRNVNRRDMS